MRLQTPLGVCVREAVRPCHTFHRRKLPDFMKGAILRIPKMEGTGEDETKQANSLGCPTAMFRVQGGWVGRGVSRFPMRKLCTSGRVTSSVETLRAEEANKTVRTARGRWIGPQATAPQEVDDYRLKILECNGLVESPKRGTQTGASTALLVNKYCCKSRMEDIVVGVPGRIAL